MYTELPQYSPAIIRIQCTLLSALVCRIHLRPTAGMDMGQIKGTFMRCRVLTWAEEGAILRSGTGLAKTAEDGVVAVAVAVTITVAVAKKVL